jgi:hypothetical protein
MLFSLTRIRPQQVIVILCVPDGKIKYLTTKVTKDNTMDTKGSSFESEYSLHTFRFFRVYFCLKGEVGDFSCF